MTDWRGGATASVGASGTNRTTAMKTAFQSQFKSSFVGILRKWDLNESVPIQIGCRNWYGIEKPFSRSAQFSVTEASGANINENGFYVDYETKSIQWLMSLCVYIIMKINIYVLSCRLRYEVQRERFLWKSKK